MLQRKEFMWKLLPKEASSAWSLTIFGKFWGGELIFSFLPRSNLPDWKVLELPNELSKIFLYCSLIARSSANSVPANDAKEVYAWHLNREVVWFLRDNCRAYVCLRCNQHSGYNKSTDLWSFSPSIIIGFSEDIQCRTGHTDIYHRSTATTCQVPDRWPALQHQQNPTKKCWGSLILGCKSLQCSYDIYNPLLHKNNWSSCSEVPTVRCFCEHNLQKNTDILFQVSIEDNVENRRSFIPVRLHISSSSASLSPVNVTALSTCR